MELLSQGGRSTALWIDSARTRSRALSSDTSSAGKGSPEQMAKQGAQVKKMLNLYKTPEGRVQIAELMTVIQLANRQPEVRAKVDEARKLVHDYIRRVAPELLPTLETMNANRETVRQNKQATDMVY